MSLFTRGLASAAAAGARVTEKYIDEDLAAQRAQMMADLQLQGQKNLDTYMNSPERRGALREQGVLDEMAKADPRITQGQIDAETAKLRGLTPARIQAESAVLEGTTPAAAKREGIMARARTDAERDATIASGSNPEYVKAVRALKLATHVESSGSIAQAELARMQIQDLRRLGTLYDQFTAIQNDDTLTDEERLKKARPIINSIQAIKSKNGTGGPGRDPELDTVTVQTEEPTPEGGTIKTTRKEVRRPGAGGGGQGQQGVSVPTLDKLREQRKQQGGGKPAAAPAEQSPIEMMTVGELRRLAAIQGHSQQQAAVAELQRRQQRAPAAAPAEDIAFPQ